MTILKALILTLAPPILGLAAYYRSIFPYTNQELAHIIGRQLWYINFQWLVIAFVLNTWILYRATRKASVKTKPANIKYDEKPSLFDV